MEGAHFSLRFIPCDMVHNICIKYMSLVQTTAFLSCTIQNLKQQNTDTEPLTSQKEVRCVHFQTHDTEDFKYNHRFIKLLRHILQYLHERTSILEQQILFMASICLPRLLSPAPPYGIAVRYEDPRYGCKMQEDGEQGSVSVPPSSDIRTVCILCG